VIIGPPAVDAPGGLTATADASTRPRRQVPRADALLVQVALGSAKRG
jgi:hypothetical protein